MNEEKNFESKEPESQSGNPLQKTVETAPEIDAEALKRSDSPKSKNTGTSEEAEKGKAVVGKHLEAGIKIENNGFIENLGNAGNVQGDFNYYATNDNLTDPTEDYPEALLLGKGWHAANEVSSYAQNLKQQRLLLVFSSNMEAADAAIISLLLSPEFDGLPMRHLVRQKFDTLDSYEIENDKSSAKQKSLKTTINGVLAIDNLLSRKINNNRPTIVVAEPESSPFVESVFACKPNDMAQYRQQMVRKNLFLIIKVDSQNLIRYIQSNRKRLLFPAWEVSGLTFVLHQNFDADTAVEYEAGLISQNKKGLWGEDLDEYDLADAIGLYLSKGKRAFEREYFRRLEILEKPPAEIARIAEEELYALQPSEFLSRKDDPVAFHLAFLGAWFEKLTVRDFDILAFHFFSDENKKVEVGKSTKRTLYSDGTVETKEVPEFKSFLKIWKESPDECRRRAHLQRVMPLGSPYHYVEFSESHLRNTTRDFFENQYPAFAAESFDTLFRLTFFDMKAEKNVLDNLARLNARMARQEPTAAFERLAGISFQIHHAEQESDAEAAERVENAEDNDLKLKEIITALSQKVEFQEYKTEYFRRIYLLVSEFWNDPLLAETVQRFLNSLLQNRLFEPVHFLVHRMWNAAEFKPLYWAQQILERGDDDAKSNTFRLVLHAAQQELARSLWEYLDEIATWLPNRDLPEGKFSRTNEYGLAFLFQFVLNTVEHTKEGKSQDSVLLGPLFTDEDGGAARWEKLLGWLFHPGIAPALYKIKDQEVYKTPGPARAFVLDTWFWQLHGSESPVSGQTETILNQMFTALKKATSLRDYRETLQFLRIRADNYRENRSERERYYVLRYFIQLFIDKNPFA